jgi:D-alanyl-D-alanine carboxypeptidase
LTVFLSTCAMARAIRVLVPLLIATSVAGCNGAAPAVNPVPTFPPATVSAINAAIASWFKEYQVPGVIVGIWMPQGTYVTAQGKADTATGEPMQVNDHFRVGSITKTFTVTVLLQLVAQGKLSLDDPVSKYVSYVPNGENITLRMLANMTSGLFNYSEDPTFIASLFSNPQQEFTPMQLIDIGLQHPPYFAPGTGFHYSNTNTVLLGAIIEHVTNENICDLYASYNFGPLGLMNTQCPSGTSMPVPYAHGITQTPSGAIVDATNWNPSWAFTAGWLISDLQDLKVWVKAYTTGAQIPASLQQQRLDWITVPPATPTDSYGLGIGMSHGWIGHEGGLPGYNTEGQYFPSKDLEVVVFANSDVDNSSGVSPAFGLFQALAKILTPQNIPVAH